MDYMTSPSTAADQTKEKSKKKNNNSNKLITDAFLSVKSWAQFWDAGIGSKNTAIRVPCCSQVCRPPCLVLHWCEQKESEVQLDKAKLMELQGLQQVFLGTDGICFNSRFFFSAPLRLPALVSPKTLSSPSPGMIQNITNALDDFGHIS